jgi:hypothetical protein
MGLVTRLRIGPGWRFGSSADSGTSETWIQSHLVYGPGRSARQAMASAGALCGADPNVRLDRDNHMKVIGSGAAPDWQYFVLTGITFAWSLRTDKHLEVN